MHGCIVQDSMLSWQHRVTLLKPQPVYCFRLWCTETATSSQAHLRRWYSTWCLRRNIIPIGRTSSPFCWAPGSSSSRTSFWARFALSASISKIWMERAVRWAHRRYTFNLRTSTQPFADTMHPRRPRVLSFHHGVMHSRLCVSLLSFWSFTYREI